MIQLQIINQIVENEVIIIHRHVRPDPDALGAQNGLAEMIRSSFPNKRVYAVGEEDPHLFFMGRMDTIEDDLYRDALVIVVDTANEERISDERFKLGKYIVKIDHHPNRQPYGDLSWVDSAYSATSEMIYELCELGKEYGFSLNSQSASLIYGGIIGDTGRFLYPNTTYRTFQIAMKLMEFNINPGEIYNHLYQTEGSLMRLNGYILQNFNYSKHQVASIKLTKEVLDSFHISSNEASNTGNDIGNLAGIKSWVTFIEEEDKIRVRLRSKGPAIHELAEKYQGGGHPLASGATVSSWAEADLLLRDLNALCQAYEEEKGQE